MPIVWGELIRNGKREEGVHPLQKQTIIIGRSSKADVKVNHHQISAQHCILIWNEVTRRVVAIDKSSNGTLHRMGSAAKRMTKNQEVELNDNDGVIVVKTTTAEKDDGVMKA